MEPAAAAAAAAKSHQSCLTLCDPTNGSPPRLLCPWDSPDKTTGVGCHFPLQYMHAKLLQSCPTLCDPMDSSPPSSPVHGILQARILEWTAISFSIWNLIKLKSFAQQRKPSTKHEKKIPY